MIDVARVARRRIRRIVGTVIAVLFVVVANAPSAVRVAVNYEVHTEQVPLYQKALAFVDRDVQMRALAGRLTAGLHDRGAMIERLFAWSHDNVRPVPPGLPIVDDYVYNVVVRGYGTHDQAADVFVELCGYVGVEGRLVFSRDGGRVLYSFALLALDGEWRPFDVREGRIFRWPDARIATLSDLRSHPELVAAVPTPAEARDAYPVFFEKLDLTDVRPVADQMPLVRLIREIGRLLPHG